MMPHRNLADEWDHPAEPEPPAFSADCDAWESQCVGVGNKTQRHGRTAHKLADRWQCGWCLRWLKLPKGRT